METYPLASDGGSGGGDQVQGPSIIINNILPKQPWLGRTLLKIVLAISIFANILIFGMIQMYFSGVWLNEKFVSGDWTASAKIAVIKFEDIITRESVATPMRELKSAAEDEEVKAVVLSVDSPGGTIAGSDELYHAIEEFKETGKKIVVWMGSMGTSGAYYISMPADQIIAERSCVTGSIGVIAQFVEIKKLLDEWGIKSEVFKSGPMKDSGSPFREMTDADREEWKNLVDKMYEQFLGVILKYRSKKIVGGEEKLRELADGRIYLAQDALDLGLIDAIGFEEDAIEAAKQLAGLDVAKIITYERPSGFMDLLEGNLQGSSQLDIHRLLDLRGPRILLLPSSFATTAE